MSNSMQKINNKKSRSCSGAGADISGGFSCCSHCQQTRIPGLRNGARSIMKLKSGFQAFEIILKVARHYYFIFGVVRYSVVGRRAEGPSGFSTPRLGGGGGGS